MALSLQALSSTLYWISLNLFIYFTSKNKLYLKLKSEILKTFTYSQVRLNKPCKNHIKFLFCSIIFIFINAHLCKNMNIFFLM